MIEDTWWWQGWKPLPRFGIIYMAENTKTGKVYIGQTLYPLTHRIKSHYYRAKSRPSKFQRALAKYDKSLWQWTVLVRGVPREKLDILEKFYIKDVGLSCSYNLTTGGSGVKYASVKDETRDKLRCVRKGRKPALGMKHTEENKRLFSKFSKKRWDLYGRYPKEVLQLRCCDAIRTYGISKTHYYRLKRQNETIG